MKLIEIMKVASSAYPDDLIMRYHKNPKHDFGDTLAKFLAAEIAETYDKDKSDFEQWTATLLVVSKACDDLHKVFVRLGEVAKISQG